MSIHSISSTSSYCNIPNAQYNYLISNVSLAAVNLYKQIYMSSTKAKGIFIKPLSYLCQMVRRGRRQVIRLVNELIRARCIRRTHRSTSEGRICNEYEILVPPEVQEYIKRNPRRASLQPAKQAQGDKNVTTLILTNKCNNINNNKAATPLVIVNFEQEIREFVDTEPLISNPQELFQEMMHAVKSRFFEGQTVKHAINTAKKLVRTGRWSRPFSLRRLDVKVEPSIPPIKPSVVYHKAENEVNRGGSRETAISALAAIKQRLMGV